jgi:carbon storage regulator CsrA
MSTIVLGKNDAIVIGNEIIVTVLAVRDDEVEVGIERPAGVSVERGEVCSAVCQTTDSHELWP